MDVLGLFQKGLNMRRVGGVANGVRGAATALVLVLGTGAFGLAGCGRGAQTSTAARTDDPSATSGSRAYADAQSGASGAQSGYGGGYGGGYARRGSSQGGEYAARTPRAPVPMFEGEPMWSDSRQHTAEENAHYHCTKSGPDIGASTFNDCLKKVHAFLDHPPADALKIKRGRNGDTLIYDPKDNIFAVARRDGAPRTFFKPRDGMDYWKQQQARETQGGADGGERRTASTGASDEG